MKPARAERQRQAACPSSQTLPPVLVSRPVRGGPRRAPPGRQGVAVRRPAAGRRAGVFPQPSWI